MKTLLRVGLVSMLLPLIVSAQTPAPAAAAPAAPRQETISMFRIWPKVGHEEQLKAALVAHAKKWHTGKWAWRVYTVVSGLDGGAYHIIEGPNSWTDLEDRGDLGKDHMNDFRTSILPHAEKISPVSFMTYNEAGSNSPAGNFSTKAGITIYQPKPGRIGPLLAQFRMAKAAAEKNGVNIAIWTSFASGEQRVAVVRRFKNGWKDLDDNTMTFRQAMESLYGAGAFDRFSEGIEANVASATSEMIVYRPELSTK